MAPKKQKQKKLAATAELPPTSIAQLEGELLILTLSRLSTARDLNSCAMVSKTWAEASTRTRPQVLHLQPHNDAQKEPKTSVHQLRWLQGLQQQGRLQGLQTAVLHEHEAGHDPERPDPSPLSQGFIVLAGSWHICRCVLHGRFCWTSAIALLPTTLSALELWPDSGPSLNYLSDFLRFPKLQMLRLGVGLADNEKENGQDVLESMLVLNAALSSLITFSVIDRLHVTLAEGHDMSSCLPNIQHISFRIEASDKGMELAQEVMDLESYLSLELDLAEGPGEGNTLVLPETTMLKELMVSAPFKTPEVSIEVEKTGVELECSFVHKVSTANVSRKSFFMVH